MEDRSLGRTGAQVSVLCLGAMTFGWKTEQDEATRMIDRFLDDPSDDPILILCKAVDLDWPTSLAVLSAKLGSPQLRESRADDANKKYRKLSTYSAQRVLRFWQARDKLAVAG